MAGKIPLHYKLYLRKGVYECSGGYHIAKFIELNGLRMEGVKFYCGANHHYKPHSHGQVWKDLLI